ncbi:response regulator [Azospirillum doebereinerae]|uniref:Response regulator n=1 Tax=Azospirillum doebereinerae TaxID=92933 RepID=A0A3S0WVJ2_9PROT|nr:response regulator [Azospirillum doebereinerae]
MAAIVACHRGHPWGQYGKNGAAALPLCSSARSRVPTNSETSTVLIVENDALLRLTTAELLESWGHAVIAAGDAAEAFALIEAGIESGARPDFALLDIRLGPGPDGISLSCTLRERWNILSIFVSANLQGEDLAQAIRTGPLHILRKPFTESDLRRVMAFARETLTDIPFDFDQERLWRKPGGGDAAP